MQNSDKIDSIERESYAPIFFQRLASVEDEHFWFRARNEIIRSLIEQMADKFPNDYRVLEIGCGTGNILRVLDKACSHGMVIGVFYIIKGNHPGKKLLLKRSPPVAYFRYDECRRYKGDENGGRL